jgi:dienelactone hydrolase
LHGSLGLPAPAKGVVLFAHGSGSGRFSPRNQFVARQLEHAGFATLLLDLLSDEEAVDRANVFDSALLAGRLHDAALWLEREPATHALPVGLFGASTGGGAALVAAARHPHLFKAVVSRGGRPDLAGTLLGRVQAPTLLIVGGWDGPVIEMNREALDELQCEKELVIVPEATHLFEEPGKLEEAARLATAWFGKNL